MRLSSAAVLKPIACGLSLHLAAFMLILLEVQDVSDGGKGVLLGVGVALQYMLHLECQREEGTK